MIDQKDWFDGWKEGLVVLCVESQEREDEENFMAGQLYVVHRITTKSDGKYVHLLGCTQEFHERSVLGTQFFTKASEEQSLLAMSTLHLTLFDALNVIETMKEVNDSLKEKVRSLELEENQDDGCCYGCVHPNEH